MLHDTLYEIADYIFSVCKENNLTCMLIYGSALGAYRHNNFIPWDDDMDLGMPREDYEKFIEIIKKCNDGYSLQNEDTEPNYFSAFAKVRKDNTLFLEKATVGLFEHNGIFVDIFPLDYVDNPDSLIYKIKSYYMTYIKHILRVSACPNVYKEKMGNIRFFIERVMCFPVKFISRYKLIKHLHTLMQNCGSKNSAKYIARFDAPLSTQLEPIEHYLPTTELVFRNKSFAVPGQIEKYLINFYGENYMQLPPEDKRITHKPLKIEY